MGADVTGSGNGVAGLTLQLVQTRNNVAETMNTTKLFTIYTLGARVAMHPRTRGRLYHIALPCPNNYDLPLTPLRPFFDLLVII